MSRVDLLDFYGFLFLMIWSELRCPDNTLDSISIHPTGSKTGIIRKADELLAPTAFKFSNLLKGPDGLIDKEKLHLLNTMCVWGDSYIGETKHP